MTAPAIEEAQLEHLDYNPCCAAERHRGARSKADFWINVHGCARLFVCRPCLASWQKEWAETIAEYGYAPCAQCFSHFMRLGDVAEVVAL
ncbi:hypothetical protein [Nocardia brasiliensis]|uniref:hypothetical protein n=1 Tax=Nocardia brasiliensis TaxID=37326 RepID=UPI00245552B8|nr:hypothetical protein [Nocardia brasiliensis]